MERVDYDIKVYDNIIEITPKNGVKDNSEYEIRLKNLKQLNGKRKLDSEKVTACTKMTPAYTSLQAVESLVESCNIPKKIILYHIREASRYVDFVRKPSTQSTATLIDYQRPTILTETTITGEVPFEVEQFVKYKAAHECILRYYIDRTSDSGNKGQLGDVQFDTTVKLADISELLKKLDGMSDEWMASMLGYKNEGRAKPVSAAKNSYVLFPRLHNDIPPVRTRF